MTNPIRRTPRRECPATQANKFACVSGGDWFAVCPDCGKVVRSDQYEKSTRKSAKDALYKHARREHAEPGNGTCLGPSA